MLRGRPGWLLDETHSAGRENLDPGHVSRYDAKEDADAPAEVALLATLGLDPRSTVVDLGAGTGQFSIAVSGSCRRVVAVDVSPPMLNVLRTKAAAADVLNVEVAHAGFLTYEHTGTAPDFVYSRYALHHLPDAWKAIALDRVYCMLRPGGIFRLWDVVYGFDAHDAPARMEAWCASESANPGHGWFRAELEEHIRDEHSTFTWLLEPMIERSGFVTRDAHYSDDGFSARYVLQKPLTVCARCATSAGASRDREPTAGRAPRADRDGPRTPRGSRSPVEPRCRRDRRCCGRRRRPSSARRTCSSGSR